MPLLLDSLTLWLDEPPRPAALNMALDEAMLLAATGAWMRVYRWAEPSISIGFSQSLDLLPEDKRHWPMVRRWTGGGVVIHDGDWTYTIAAPSGHSLSNERASETYRAIHAAMIEAMEDCGISGATLQPENTSDGMGVCFVEPARYDVVWQGQKIAGAAQRRNRTGFLHQGSVQQAPLPPDFGPIFAKRLAMNVILAPPRPTLESLLPVANRLAAAKYETESWTHDRNVATPVTTA